MSSAWQKVIIVERPATDDPTLLEVVTIVDPGATNYRRYRLIEDDPTLPPVSGGVTSSDERACENCGGDRRARHDDGTIWAGKSCPLCVPSSDEPEGDDPEMVARIERCARALWRMERPKSKPWHLAEHSQREDYRSSVQRVLEVDDEHRSPVPVGDAEPVAWPTMRQVDAARDWLRKHPAPDLLWGPAMGEMLHAMFAVRPLYALPVSSQDAGELAAMVEVRAILSGKRAEEAGVMQRSVTRCMLAIDVIDDALRAAAGKAGSDDAR